MTQLVHDAADLIRRATAPLIVGHTVDLKQLHVEPALNLESAQLGNVDFSGSVFARRVSFRGSTFGGLAWFRNCRFDGGLDVSNCVFENDCRLDGARVVGTFDAGAVEFRGIGCFDRARFEQAAQFEGLLALGNLSLAGTVFAGAASFRRADFQGGIWLDQTRFLGRVAFDGAEVHGRSWLKPTTQIGTGGLTSYGYIYA